MSNVMKGRELLFWVAQGKGEDEEGQDFVSLVWVS